MFDRLIEFLLDVVERSYFFQIVNAYEQGVHLRNGKLLRTVEPGIWFICPVIDEVLKDTVVTRTVNLNAQSLTTKDAVSIVVGGVVTLSIGNIKKAILEVEGVDGALRDSCLGEIADLVGEYTWAELNSEPFIDELTNRCYGRGLEYGLRIKRVKLSDLARMRALRIHMDNINTFKE